MVQAPETPAEPSPQPEPGGPRARAPWWIPPFLGRVPDEIEPAQLRLLGVIALALFIEEYDLAMLSSALHRIADSLGVAWAGPEMSLRLGLIRIGALPAFFVIPFADRIGRRRVFLGSLVVTGLLTFLTAFAQNIDQFVLLQAMTRTFFVTGSAVAFVMIAEEFPAAHRGWGLGMLGALGVCGHGLALLVYSQVELLPFGWRFLYGLGILPVLFLPMFRRRVKETRRYTEHHAQRGEDDVGGIARSFEPLIEIARRYPGRALGIAAVGFLPSIGLISAFQFAGAFVQEIRGWTPGAYVVMTLLAGAIGIVGNVVAGRLGDDYGRRRVGFVLLGSFPIWVTLFYRGPGWLVAPAWTAIVFASSGGRMILRTLATELFPTSQRASAAGLFAILDTLGAALGLFLLAAMQTRGLSGPESLPWLTPILSIAVLAGGALLWFFPETKQRELEAISH